MKKFACIIGLFLIVSHLLAQDCSKYLFLQKNKQIEYTAYDAQGKALRKSISTVMEVNTINGIVTSKLVTVATLADGKPSKTYISFKCTGGEIMINMNFGDGKPGSSGENMDFSYLQYPTNMKVGDHLKDAISPIKVVAGKITITGTSKTTERIVAAKENITTPAGTWSCFKITYKIITVIDPIKGGTKIPAQTEECTEWYAPNFSVMKIKTEDNTIEITGIK